MVILDSRDARPIYEQIGQALRQQIRGGVLVPGEKLPSVRELALELSINPNTIQRAYRELENEGFIISIPGKGSFVCPQKTGPEQNRDALLAAFDDAARALMDQGMAPAELCARVNTIKR